MILIHRGRSTCRHHGRSDGRRSSFPSSSPVTLMSRNYHHHSHVKSARSAACCNQNIISSNLFSNLLTSHLHSIIKMYISQIVVLSLALLLLLPHGAIVVRGFVMPPSTIRQQYLDHKLPTTNPPLSRDGWKQQQQQQQRTPSQQTPSRQRRGSVRMHGIFGLGVGEIAVIVVVIGFVLGPQNIGKLLRSSVDRASALKDELDRVPEEFQKGLEEGESNVRSRKAKRIKVVRENEKDDE